MSERLIDKLKADFASRRRMVTVMGLDVWVTPLSIGEQTAVATMHPDDGAKRMAEILIRKCKDGEGRALFTLDDKAALQREVAGDSLAPLIAAIVGPSVEAQEKNSAAVDQPTS